MAEHIPNTAIWADGSGTTFQATAEAIAEGIVDFEIGALITVDPEAEVLERVATVNKQYGLDIKPYVVDGQPHKRQTDKSVDEVLEIMDRDGIYNLSLMGGMVLLGNRLIDELNGDVPEQNLPQTIDEARKLLIEDPAGEGFHLPYSFWLDPGIDTPLYRIRNTHPAPTIVTANTHGEGAYRRVIDLRLLKSAQTLHIVGKGIDSGVVVAAHAVTVDLPPKGAPYAVREAAVEKLKKRVMRIEKAHLPLDLNEEFALQALMIAYEKEHQNEEQEGDT